MRSVLRTAFLALLFFCSTAQANVVLKIGTLAPDGTAWMNLFRTFATNVATRTSERVKIKFYTGGVQGDEVDMLRKIRLGQLAGAAITGVGLSTIDPELRALDVARSYEEMDALRVALTPRLRKKLEAKGFVLGAWGEVGPIHLFSPKPVKTMDDMRSLKLWLWNEDPISKQLFAALGLRGVPLGVPEVLPALATGQIDSVFGSPLATVALQWSTHAKYMTSMVMGEASGATILSKKVWDTISPEDQKILTEEADALQPKVLEQVRKDNAKSLELMKKQGITVVETPAALQKELEERAEAMARSVSAQFDKGLQDEVEKVLLKFRPQMKRATK